MTALTTTIGATAINDTLANVSGSGSDLMASVLVLAKGMLGIFLFMLMFYLLIYGLEKLFAVRSKHEA
ncbi:MAG: hypothetical protein V3576_05220 [Candidatus Cloacimonadota bacterium]